VPLRLQREPLLAQNARMDYFLRALSTVSTAQFAKMENTTTVEIARSVTTSSVSWF
jgi:hypothetical protein